MICPHCRNVHSPKEVMQTWTVKNGTVKRKRRCSRCKTEFHTVEMVAIRKQEALYRLKPNERVIVA